MEGMLRRQVSLRKGQDWYIFLFPKGHEGEAIKAMAALAAVPDSGFDFFDAAVMSYQMGRHLELNIKAETLK